MIPGITNSGSMPIQASGGAAGPVSSDSTNNIGGITGGSVQFGDDPMESLVKSLPLVIAVGLFAWVALKK